MARAARYSVSALSHVPKSRSTFPRLLASSRSNLGNVLRDFGTWDKAETEYRAALAIFTKLLAEFPAVPSYRRDFATTHASLGILLHYDLKKRWDQAAAEYRAAIAIQQKLVADFPNVPDYRARLASSHYNLGNALDNLGERDQAGTEFRTAMAIRRKLV